MIYLSNAFSLQMLDLESKPTVTVTPVDAAEVTAADFVSVVGHADTAAVLSNMLGKDVAYNRVSLRLEEGDILYVGQVVGGRLPEGSTTLPDGIRINFVRVDLV